MKQKPKNTARRPRNPLACHPLMAKGGMHRKSEKARRKAAKQALKREAMTEKFIAIVGFRHCLTAIAVAN